MTSSTVQAGGIAISFIFMIGAAGMVYMLARSLGELWRLLLALAVGALILFKAVIPAADKAITDQVEQIHVIEPAP